MTSVQVPVFLVTSCFPRMEILFLLIGFSLLVALFFLGCFFWAVQSGQYEDRYTPALRILFEERPPQAVKIKSQLEDSTYAE